METFDQLQVILIIYSIAANILLAFWVIKKNKSSATNLLFFTLSIITSIWLFIMYISFEPQFLSSSLLWIRLSIMFAVVQSILFFLLAHTIPNEKLFINTKWLVPLLSLGGVIIVLASSSLVFPNIEINSSSPQPLPGPGMIAFSVYVTSLSIGAIYTLIKKNINSQGIEKQQLRFVTAGILLMLSLIIFTILVPVAIFQNNFFVPFAPVYALIFLGMTAYAIVKHHLFDLKVIATEALVAIVWVILFSKLFLSQSTSELILNGFLFVAMVVFGIYLVRSVLKEIKQREQLQVLTKKLKVANAKLWELDKLKTEFLSITSHQLRTPMTGIKGYISMMMEGDFGKFTKKQSEVLYRVRSEVDRLIRLIQVFLNVSRIESGRLSIDKTEFNLAALVHTIIKELEIAARAKNLKLCYQDGKEILITADQDKLKDVIVNMVDNAIKYTVKGSVTVEITKKQNTVQLAVQDTGVGIDPKEAEKLFQKFSRMKGIAKVSASGSGLGLFIAKKIIEAHGGTIWAESKGKGKGSQFVFTIPKK